MLPKFVQVHRIRHIGDGPPRPRERSRASGMEYVTYPLRVLLRAVLFEVAEAISTFLSEVSSA